MPEQGNDISEVELDKLIEESYARKAEAEDVFARHDSDQSGTIDSKELKAVLEELAKEEGLNDEDVQLYTSSGRDKKAAGESEKGLSFESFVLVYNDFKDYVLNRKEEDAAAAAAAPAEGGDAAPAEGGDAPADAAPAESGDAPADAAPAEGGDAPADAAPAEDATPAEGGDASAAKE